MGVESELKPAAKAEGSGAVAPAAGPPPAPSSIVVTTPLHRRPAKPAAALMQHNNNFASVEDLESMIFAAQERLGRLPTAADVWEEVFDSVATVLADAEKAKRGIYFGNV